MSEQAEYSVHGNRSPVVRRILGRPVHRVEDAEELLWRVAQFLDSPSDPHERKNLRTRILKALDGGDWRASLTDDDDERYA